jgi:DNA-binding IclR family transcriptional regulator
MKRTQTEIRHSPAPALSCGLALLEFIAHFYRPVSLQEFASHFGWPKSSIIRYLRVLREKGYVRRDANTGLYSNSSIVLSHFSKGLKHFFETLTHDIAFLADEIGKTVELIAQDKKGNTWLEKIDGSNDMLAVKAEVGFKRNYDEFDCLTRIYFAFSGDSYIGRSFYDSAKRMVPPQNIRPAIEKVQREKFAFDIVGNSNGIRRYAAPILNPNSELLGVISIAEAAVSQNPVTATYYRNCLHRITEKSQYKRAPLMLEDSFS